LPIKKQRGTGRSPKKVQSIHRPLKLRTPEASDETPQVDVSISIKSVASMAGPGLNSEPQNSRIMNRRISKDRIAALCPFNQYKSIEFLPSTFDLRYSVFDIRFFNIRMRSCKAKVSFSIKLTASAGSGVADPPSAEHLPFPLPPALPLNLEP